jgi:hypothetical protein
MTRYQVGLIVSVATSCFLAVRYVQLARAELSSRNHVIRLGVDSTRSYNERTALKAALLRTQLVEPVLRGRDVKADSEVTISSATPILLTRFSVTCPACLQSLPFLQAVGSTGLAQVWVYSESDTPASLDSLLRPFPAIHGLTNADGSGVSIIPTHVTPVLNLIVKGRSVMLLPRRCS